MVSMHPAEHMSQASAAQGPVVSAGVTDPVEGMAVADRAAAGEDGDAAIAVWVQHAHRGNARVQAEIGRCFSNGWGLRRGVDPTGKWLVPAAQAGEPLAQCLFGDVDFNGEDGLPQRSIDEEWYARAAHQGDAHAQNMLSWLLTDGDHCQPDYGQAMRGALQGVAQGVAAAIGIGLLYNDALGVERDVAVAARWWRKAALLGDGDGQAMLGATHHLGAGAERDRVTALTWLTTARRLRSRFFHSSCTPQQRREAERRASLRIGAQEPSP